MRITHARPIVLAACAVAAAALAGCQKPLEGVTLRQRTVTAAQEGRVEESTQYWTANSMLLDDERNRLIVDFDAGTLTSLDKGKQIFSVLSFDQLRERVAARQRRTAADTADYPDEAKAELKKMGELAGDDVAQIEVEATGKRETIAGYDAEEYAFKGTMVVGSVWVTPELPLPLGEAQRAAYRGSTTGMAAANMQLALAMLKLDRIPLRTVMRAATEPERILVTNEVVEVGRHGPPADLLGIPRGFSEAPPLPTPQELG